jgi:hypothetical protein
MVGPVQSNFERILEGLEPDLRRLLAELGVIAASDLRRVDPWTLISRQGVGRGTVRALIQFMESQGVHVPPRTNKPATLTVSLPADVSEHVRATAASQGRTPSEWVVSLVRSGLGSGEA